MDGTDIVIRDAVVTDHAWPNKARHKDFGTAERKPPRKMSRWLADKQYFPKF